MTLNKEERRLIILELTEQEAQTIFEIVDAACRANGLKIAGACTFIAQKLTEAVRASQVTKGAAKPGGAKVPFRPKLVSAKRNNGT